MKENSLQIERLCAEPESSFLYAVNRDDSIKGWLLQPERSAVWTVMVRCVYSRIWTDSWGQCSSDGRGGGLYVSAGRPKHSCGSVWNLSERPDAVGAGQTAA